MGPGERRGPRRKTWLQERDVAPGGRRGPNKKTWVQLHTQSQLTTTVTVFKSQREIMCFWVELWSLIFIYTHVTSEKIENSYRLPGAHYDVTFVYIKSSWF